MTGDFEMRNGAITIVTEEGVVAAVRKDLIGMTVGEESEIRYWSGGASIGFSGRAGNAKQSDLNLGANVMRLTTLTRAKASYTGAFSSSEGVSTASSQESDVALVFNTLIELDLPRGIEWDNSYSIQIVATDIGKTSQHLESKLSLDIWGPLDFEVAFYFDRVEDPVPRSATDVPKSNDYRATIGLGFDI